MRRYTGDARSDAAEIARDVVQHGASDGWSGEIAQRAAVAVILRPYAIVYVDDMKGTWAQRRSCRYDSRCGFCEAGVAHTLEQHRSSISDAGL